MTVFLFFYYYFGFLEPVYIKKEKSTEQVIKWEKKLKLTDTRQVVPIYNRSIPAYVLVRFPWSFAVHLLLGNLTRN